MSELNSLFLAQLDTAEGLQKTAAFTRTFVRDKLRENSFLRAIVPPQKITKAECTPSVNHDNLTYIDEIEPESRAMSMTFRGQPTARYVSGPRYHIPFFTISTERFEKTTQELMAYRMPITKVIERNGVKDIQEIEDYRGLLHIEAAVQTTGKIVRGVQATDDASVNGAGAGLRGTLQRADLIALRKELSKTRRHCAMYLMNEENWDDILHWTVEDNGDKRQSDVVVNGLTSKTVMGTRVVRTIKTDILLTGNIFAFTESDFLGKFLLLNNTEFYINKEANLISWQAWEDIGFGIGNIASIAKLELYNGQGGGNNDSDALAAEEDVGGGVFNRAAQGDTFPQVVLV